MKKYLIIILTSYLISGCNEKDKQNALSSDEVSSKSAKSQQQDKEQSTYLKSANNSEKLQLLLSENDKYNSKYKEKYDLKGEDQEAWEKYNRDKYDNLKKILKKFNPVGQNMSDYLRAIGHYEHIIDNQGVDVFKSEGTDVVSFSYAIGKDKDQLTWKSHVELSFALKDGVITKMHL